MTKSDRAMAIIMLVLFVGTAYFGHMTNVYLSQGAPGPAWFFIGLTVVLWVFGYKLTKLIRIVGI